MATFNTSHHETGGVVLFSGELILLYCDNVNLSLPQTSQSETGRLYLTTHRMVFTNKSMKHNLKSFSAPFYTMHDLGLEQPIFGANYIKGKVKDASTDNPIAFKLKFVSGGAIEYGQALQSAARMTQNMAAQQAFQPPPAYSPSASAYYQAPPNSYQPAYNVGFVLPTDVFNQPPPAGFVYTMSDAPPPYPGLGPQTSPAGYYPNPGSVAAGQAFPPTGGYPPASNANQPGFAPGITAGFQPSASGYPATNQPPAYPVATGAPAYPTANQPPIYPAANGAPSYPGSNQPPAYPGSTGYPGSNQPAGYPAANGVPSYPNAAGGQSGVAGYPPLHDDVFANASAPSDSNPEKKPW